MKYFNTSFLRSSLFMTALLATLNTTAQHQMPGRIHAGLIYPVSTNGTHAPADTNYFSLHLIAGVSAAERGPSFAGISNVVRNDVKGPMFAGFSNHAGKDVDGALFAGFLNTYGGGTGPAFGGFANIATGDVTGAQFAGFSNFSRSVKGAQFAGFINTAKDVNGSQFAGFINIGRKVKGAQIAGFINIADSSDCPVGIVNIIRNGEKNISASIDETQTSMLSFRSGGKVMYGIIGLGYNFKNKDAVYAAEAGLGAHFFESSYFRLNTEILSMTLTDFKRGSYFKGSLRLLPALKIGDYLELFAGPSLNFITTNTAEGEKLRDKYLKKWPGEWDEDFRGLYIGYTGGIALRF